MQADSWLKYLANHYLDMIKNMLYRPAIHDPRHVSATWQAKPVNFA
jgi:hypothetical protein